MFVIFYPRFFKPKQQVPAAVSGEEQEELPSNEARVTASPAQHRRKIKQRDKDSEAPKEKPSFSCPFPAHQDPSSIYARVCSLPHLFNVFILYSLAHSRQHTLQHLQ